jgi:TRAP-type mannitol/chloroaromatic compound transport system permease small subunit
MESKSSLRIAGKIDRGIFKIGNIAAWLNFILLVLIILQISLRYLYGRGFVILEELQWHLYAVAFMFAISYSQASDNHIRLDIFRDHFSDKTKEIIEILGILFLVFPFIIILFLHGLDFWYESWRLNESSGSPMGLPCRWIIKAFIPIGMVTLAVAMISRLIKAFHFLARYNKD